MPPISTGHAPASPSMAGTVTAAKIAHTLRAVITVSATTSGDARGGFGAMR